MSSGHHHPASHAVAATPTLSLLRLSAAERLIGAAVVIALLWFLVIWTI